jgi:hypothetical protein
MSDLVNCSNFGLGVVGENKLYLLMAYLSFYRSSPLTLILPGSRKSVNYWDSFSFELAFTRCKLTTPSIWQECNKALRFQKSAQNGAATSKHLERVREQARLRTRIP